MERGYRVLKTIFTGEVKNYNFFGLNRFAEGVDGLIVEG